MLTRDLLLCLKSSRVTLDASVRHIIAQLRLARRGCRAGKNRRRRPTLHSSYAYPQAQQVACTCDHSRYRRSCDHQLIPIIIGNRARNRAVSPHLHNEALAKKRSLTLIRRISNSVTHSKFGVFNARSIANKFLSISSWIVDQDLCFAAIVETWHFSSDSPDLLACAPSGYSFMECARPTHDDTYIVTNHGGVCLFYRATYKARRIDTPVYPTFEHLCVHLDGGGLNLLVVVLYRPGSQRATDSFLNDIADLLERVVTFMAPLMLLGDLNLHLDTPDDPLSAKFGSLLDIYSLKQRIYSPTHSAGHTLDVIITRQDVDVLNICVDPPGILSDHSLITAALRRSDRDNHTRARCVQRRSWRQFDIDAFSSDLHQLVESVIQSPVPDVNGLFSLYDTVMRNLIDKHAPLRTVQISRRHSAPWFDEDCRAAKAKRRQLERHYRRLLTPDTLEAWRLHSKIVRQLFQDKFKQYWTREIQSCGGNSRAIWAKVDRLAKPPPTSVSHFKVNDFATFFTEKIARIREQTSNAPEVEIIKRQTPPFSFYPVTPTEIKALLSKLPNKQCSLDPIPTWLLREVADVIAPLLSLMCNTSLDTGTCADACKSAIVLPRLKKPTLDPGDLKSFRPISNLSFVSKLVERTVVARFAEFSERNHLLPVHQSAYRRFHSTETAVIKVHNDLVRAIDDGKVTALVLLDLSSAFDTVDHDILLRVLEERFGVSEVPLGWFRSYLTGREQIFRHLNDSSPALSLECSVPQGSSLGPIAFITYTEDFALIFQRHDLRHHIFADDKQIYDNVDIKDVGLALGRLQNCITEVQGWCSSRRLQLNASKTELAWFGSHANMLKLSNTDCSLALQGTIVRPSSVIRDLGVLFDNELTMKQHVGQLAKSCFYHIRRIRQICRIAGKEVASQLVSAFVLSRLDYCNSVLAGLPKSTLANLQRVQNAAARLVLDLKPRDHVTPALRELHWLPVQSRIQHKLCTLMFCAQNGLCPTYLADLLQPTSTAIGRPGLRSASTSQYQKPRLRTVMGPRAFSYAGPHAWNTLPPALRNIKSPVAFRKHLKTHLFNCAYNN